jgi:hypothetical protein
MRQLTSVHLNEVPTVNVATPYLIRTLPIEMLGPISVIPYLFILAYVPGRHARACHNTISPHSIPLKPYCKSRTRAGPHVSGQAGNHCLRSCVGPYSNPLRAFPENGPRSLPSYANLSCSRPRHHSTKCHTCLPMHRLSAGRWLSVGHGISTEHQLAAVHLLAVGIWFSY